MMNLGVQQHGYPRSLGCRQCLIQQRSVDYTFVVVRNNHLPKLTGNLDEFKPLLTCRTLEYYNICVHYLLTGEVYSINEIGFLDNRSISKTMLE